MPRLSIVLITRNEAANIAGGQCVAHEYQQQNQQRRGADFVGGLDAALQATGRDHDHHGHESRVPGGNLEGSGLKFAPQVCNMLRAGGGQQADRTLPRVSQHPGGNDRVIGEDQISRESAQNANGIPARIAGHRASSVRWTQP